MGGAGAAGEDVIIGMVDGGVWPEHPSFSDRTGANKNGVSGKLSYQQIPGWHGKCVPGEEFNASNCNQKLIGAQYFVEGRLANLAGARLRVPVAARLRRPRHPHILHGRRQRRRPAAGLVRQDERHRAAGAHRDL